MKTDRQFYEIFAANPEWFFELIARPSPGRSTMQSVALKETERTTDALIVPDDPSQPLTIGEFQFQLDRSIYARTVNTMARIQLKYPERSVQGFILFGSPSHDPKIEPWTRVVECFNLEAVVNRLEQSDPTHPLPTVFKPLLVSDEEVLEREAVGYLRHIRASPLEQPLRETLEDVLINWFEQRFKDKTAEEISAMFQQELPDLRDTRSGRQLMAIGREVGELQSLRKSVKRIAGLAGPLTAEVLAKIDAINSVERLDEIELRLLSGTSIEDLL